MFQKEICIVVHILLFLWLLKYKEIELKRRLRNEIDGLDEIDGLEPRIKYKFLWDDVVQCQYSILV